MYEYFSGKLIEKTPTYAVIDCGGVGYVLNISLSTFSQITNPDKCLLYAHLAVREDAHVLYGFATRSERETFRLLINVSGVGAGTARMILSSLSSSEIAEAVMSNNVTTLKNVKGIGEKTAQRIIVDLKGKFDRDSVSPELFAGLHNTVRSEALTALTLLGFPKINAEKALDKVIKSAGQELSVEDMIKQTLKML
ncbi:MAG TPA: Holliday junction branch migration protein RuvA [Flavobacteriales bacterium]|jgi:Holliday junction DNA helicase RuvA|nr:Holliday junction branch migration protein RuvA [Flavobacteriales bacterium]HPH81600.1 Holliday junction branch migration protein RuvA [Flavobacteriales bacterium]